MGYGVHVWNSSYTDHRYLTKSELKGGEEDVVCSHVGCMYTNSLVDVVCTHVGCMFTYSLVHVDVVCTHVVW